MSTPAAKRMLAKEAVVEKQNIVREMLVAPAPVKFSGPVLRNRRYPESVHNKFMRTSYQAAFGSKRMAGLSARIKLRAAAEEACCSGGAVKEKKRNLSLVRMLITQGKQTHTEKREET